MTGLLIETDQHDDHPYQSVRLQYSAAGNFSNQSLVLRVTFRTHPVSLFADHYFQRNGNAQKGFQTFMYSSAAKHSTTLLNETHPHHGATSSKRIHDAFSLSRKPSKDSAP